MEGNGRPLSTATANGQDSNKSHVADQSNTERIVPGVAVDAAVEVANRFGPVFPLDHPDLARCAGKHGRHAPCDGTRGKHPAAKWSTEATTDRVKIEAMFGGVLRNIGLACGPAGLLVVDEDEPGAFSRYAASIGQAVPETYTVKTARGRHFYFKQDGTLGNSDGALRDLKIDVRGMGGMVVAAGSKHSSGVTYLPDDATAATAPVPPWLADTLRTRTRAPAKTKQADAIKSHALAAPVNHLTASRRHVGPIQHDRHKAFVSYAGDMLHRGLPLHEAEVLMSKRWEDAAQPAEDPYPLDQALTDLRDVYARYDSPGRVEGAPEEGTPGPSDAATWAPQDLSSLLDGSYVAPVPTLLRRSDGRGLLYRGLTHSVHGESESGKSLLMQMECARLLEAGEDVLYLDFESDGASVVERLRSFGASPAAILRHFSYVRPGADPFRITSEHLAWQQLLSGSYALVVIDGVTDALHTFGYATKDNDGITAFNREVPRRLADQTGAAVVLIDHVTKDGDSRGRFAIGGQAKMNGLTGAAYTIDVIEPLGRGLRGVIVLRVAKDRPGSVRASCGEFRKGDRTQEAARIVVDSRHPGSVVVAVEGPRSEGGPARTFRPTGLMERASRLLEEQPGLTKNALVAKMGGKREASLQAVDVLVDEGYASREPGPNNGQVHTSRRAYRQASDPQADSYEGRGTTGASGEAVGGSGPYTGGPGTTPDVVPRADENHWEPLRWYRPSMNYQTLAWIGPDRLPSREALNAVA